MKKAVVYSSVTGNTRKLSEAICDKVGAQYCGKPCDEALEAETIFIGFWTTKNSCGEDIKGFIEKLSDKQVFIFGTAGYNNTKEYFDEILNSVKAVVPDSNTIVGAYMCQGKVSDTMKAKIKDMKPEMYEAIKEKLAVGESHPDENDISELLAKVESKNI